MRRVVITGFGAVTPIGLDASSTWEAAVAGRSGIGFIESFDASGYPVRIAGEVRGFDPSALVPAKEARRMDRNVLLAVAAAQEAWDEAGIEEFDPARVGILVGSAIGGIATIAEQQQMFLERGADRVSPFFIPSALVDTASGQIAIQLGITGPNCAPVSACATGSTAIGEGAATIGAVRPTSCSRRHRGRSSRSSSPASARCGGSWPRRSTRRSRCARSTRRGPAS